MACVARSTSSAGKFAPQCTTMTVSSRMASNRFMPLICRTKDRSPADGRSRSAAGRACDARPWSRTSCSAMLRRATSACTGAGRRRLRVDVEVFARNIARMVEEGGKALAAYLKPREDGDGRDRVGRRDGRRRQDARPGRRILARRPAARGRAADQPRQGLSRSLGRGGRSGWPAKTTAPVAAARRRGQALRRSRMVVEPVLRLPEAGLSAHHALGRTSGDRTPRLDEHTRQKAEFYVRQIANAVSPSNFVLTNPELLRETLRSNAENLVRGMQHAGRGHRGRRRQAEDPPVRRRRSSRSAAISRSRPARSSSRTS